MQENQQNGDLRGVPFRRLKGKEMTDPGEVVSSDLEEFGGGIAAASPHIMPSLAVDPEEVGDHAASITEGGDS